MVGDVTSQEHMCYETRLSVTQLRLTGKRVLLAMVYEKGETTEAAKEEPYQRGEEEEECFRRTHYSMKYDSNPQSIAPLRNIVCTARVNGEYGRRC